MSIELESPILDTNMNIVEERSADRRRDIPTTNIRPITQRYRLRFDCWKCSLGWLAFSILFFYSSFIILGSITYGISLTLFAAFVSQKLIEAGYPLTKTRQMFILLTSLLAYYIVFNIFIVGMVS